MTLFDEEWTSDGDDPLGPSARVRMLVAYDGREFHGFAANPGVRTVGGTLAASIARVLGHDVVLTCAGRTDAGVHAWGQVVSFDARRDGLDLAKIRRAVNRMLSPEVVVRSVDLPPVGFDARRSAIARRYRYTIVNRDVPDPFLATTAWHVDEPLSLASMRLACDPLIGEHDFSSFCRTPRGVQNPSMCRTVTEAAWSEVADGILRFEIQAGSFCQQMVRSLVGMMIDIGLGRRRAGEVGGMLRARDRSVVSRIAPPHGLCLWQVMYPPDEEMTTGS